MFSATHPFAPQKNKTEIGDTAPLSSAVTSLNLLHIISLICAQRFPASSFYRTNLVEVANVGRMTQILPVKSETGQEIRRRTSDILPVQEHQRFIGAYIEVCRLRDPPGH